MSGPTPTPRYTFEGRTPEAPPNASNPKSRMSGRSQDTSHASTLCPQPHDGTVLVRPGQSKPLTDSAQDRQKSPPANGQPDESTAGPSTGSEAPCHSDGPTPVPTPAQQSTAPVPV